MKISKLLNCIQENLNSGCLTLDSEVCIRNDYGDIYPVEDVRIEENELLLAEQEPLEFRGDTMKHLVIFYTENGVYSATYNFKNTPPTVEDIKEMQKDMQRRENLFQIPAIVNWLPVSD